MSKCFRERIRFCFRLIYLIRSDGLVQSLLWLPFVLTYISIIYFKLFLFASKMTKLTTLNPITLKASAKILTDYLRKLSLFLNWHVFLMRFFAIGYSFNFILYLRGVENEKLFDKVSRYGLTLFLTNDFFVFSYLECVLDQMLSKSINRNTN